MKKLILFLILCTGGIYICRAQTTDTARSVKVNTVHAYFIVSAGTVINAYFKDKPLSIETIEDFNTYVQANTKSLKDAQVIVTGKPKAGTFDEVLKTLSHYRIKNVTKNILPN